MRDWLDAIFELAVYCCEWLVVSVDRIHLIYIIGLRTIA